MWDLMSPFWDGRVGQKNKALLTYRGCWRRSERLYWAFCGVEGRPGTHHTDLNSAERYPRLQHPCLAQVLGGTHCGAVTGAAPEGHYKCLALKNIEDRCPKDVVSKGEGTRRG